MGGAAGVAEGVGYRYGALGGVVFEDGSGAVGIGGCFEEVAFVVGVASCVAVGVDYVFELLVGVIDVACGVASWVCGVFNVAGGVILYHGGLRWLAAAGNGDCERLAAGVVGVGGDNASWFRVLSRGERKHFVQAPSRTQACL